VNFKLITAEERQEHSAASRNQKRQNHGRTESYWRQPSRSYDSVCLLRLQKKSSRLASHLDLKAGFFAGFSQGLEKSCRSRAPAYSTLSFRGMETTISDSEQPGNDKLDSAEKPHMVKN